MPDPSPYELYTFSGAPRPWRVALALVAKQLPFTLHVLEASRKEHKAPAFLAINPRGRTPVLRKDDFVLTESLAILAHLEQAHPARPLFAPDPSRIWEQVMSFDHDLREAAADVNTAIFKGGEPTPEAVARLRAELMRLDAQLATQAFLAGPAITAADCVAFPEVRLTLRATERAPELTRKLGLAPFAEVLPHLARWIERIEAQPGYARTFPTHWT